MRIITGNRVIVVNPGGEETYYNAKGQKLKKALKATGKGIGKAAKATGKGIAKAAKAIGKAIVKLEQKIVKRSKEVAKNVKRRRMDRTRKRAERRLIRKQNKQGKDVFQKPVEPLKQKPDGTYEKTAPDGTKQTLTEKDVTSAGDKKFATSDLDKNKPVTESVDPDTGAVSFGQDFEAHEVVADEGDDGNMDYYPEKDSGGMSDNLKYGLIIGGVIIVGVIVTVIIVSRKNKGK